LPLWNSVLEMTFFFELLAFDASFSPQATLGPPLALISGNFSLRRKRIFAAARGSFPTPSSFFAAARGSPSVFVRIFFADFRASTLTRCGSRPYRRLRPFPSRVPLLPQTRDLILPVGYPAFPLPLGPSGPSVLSLSRPFCHRNE